jgi:hypothetical protein
MPLGGRWQVEAEGGHGLRLAAAVLLVAFPATWGFSVLLAPIAIALCVVAWFRSRRDGLFWTSVGLNVLVVIEFVAKLGELTWP